MVRNEDGSVHSGSAVIMDVVYVKDGKYHSKQVQREKLGKVVSLDPSKRRGVFMSPTRGLVGYDVDEDRFYDPDEMSPTKEPVAEAPVAEAAPEEPKPAPSKCVHKVFGDAYLALEVMRSSGELARIRAAFAEDSIYEGIVVRVMHKIAADGSKIPLKAFVTRSFVSEVFSKDSLKDDKFYHELGSTVNKAAIKGMLSTDRVPFFSDATDYSGPRMMLEFDGVGGKPVRCEPVVDTSRWSLDHDGDGVAILGEGYVSESLFKTYGPDSGMTFIAAMPTSKGFPYKDLCQKALKRVGEKECTFEVNGHEFFAMRKKIEMFGKKAYAYVVSDMGRYGVPSPMFKVLVSNKGGSPELVADAYASGVKIEMSYRESLPQDMPPQDACGMIMCDLISTHVRNTIAISLSMSSVSLSEALGAAQSVMCAIDEEIVVEKTKSASKVFDKLSLKIPKELSASEYRDSIMDPEMS